MSLRLGDVAPNFKAQTTPEKLIFTNTWEIAGGYCSPIRLTIHRLYNGAW
jgi:hypothetical protein